MGSRSGGQSARAKADYIERAGRYEQDREELEHRESGNMPKWAKDDPRSVLGGGRRSTSGPTGSSTARSNSRFPRS